MGSNVFKSFSQVQKVQKVWLLVGSGKKRPDLSKWFITTLTRSRTSTWLKMLPLWTANSPQLNISKGSDAARVHWGPPGPRARHIPRGGSSWRWWRWGCSAPCLWRSSSSSSPAPGRPTWPCSRTRRWSRVMKLCSMLAIRSLCPSSCLRNIIMDPSVSS